MIRVLDRDDSAPGEIKLVTSVKGSALSVHSTITLVEAMRLKNELQQKIHEVQAYEMADHGREA